MKPLPNLLPRSTRILVVFGTRPEAIKLAPVIRALLGTADRFETIVCSTGQHRDILLPILEQLEIRPDHMLDVLRPGQGLEQTFGKILEAVSGLIREQQPDIVMVHGDVTTTLAATLAAVYQRVRVAHVEAGLRTPTKWAPWPEELHRRLVAQACDWHFAPTEVSRGNLLREGVPAHAITVTGNTGIDTLLWVLEKRLRIDPDGSERRRDNRILVTMHRREASDDEQRGIAHVLSSIAGSFPDYEVLFPVHPNPRIRAAFACAAPQPNLRFVEPLNYVEFVRTLATSTMVLTDSGGVQEEAPVVGTPTLILREDTCRPESVSAGVSKVVGLQPDRVKAEVRRLLEDADHYRAMSRVCRPYGDGHAAERIVATLSGTASACRVPEWGLAS